MSLSQEDKEGADIRKSEFYVPHDDNEEKRPPLVTEYSISKPDRQLNGETDTTMPRSTVLRLRQRHGKGGGERGGEGGGGARSKRLSLADAIVGRSEYKFSYML